MLKDSILIILLFSYTFFLGYVTYKDTSLKDKNLLRDKINIDLTSSDMKRLELLMLKKNILDDRKMLREIIKDIKGKC